MDQEKVVTFGSGPLPEGAFMMVPRGSVSVRMFCQGEYDDSLSDQHAESSWGTYVFDGAGPDGGLRRFRWVTAAGWRVG